jgi:hypothetical protein
MDAVKELVRQHWNGRAAKFDEEASHGLLNESQTLAWRRLIAEVAGPSQLDVLDIGCGTGFLSLLFVSGGGDGLISSGSESHISQLLASYASMKSWGEHAP